MKVKIVGSGKIKDKERDTKDGNELKKRNKLGKLDTIRISTVDHLKFTSEKVSESLTTFLNMNGERNAIPSEEEAKIYKPLMTQKARLKEETIPEEKKSATLDNTKISQPIFAGTLNSRQALEKSFLDRFNEVAHLDKEKNIKFFGCVGDPTFTKENEEDILNERQHNKVNNSYLSLNIKASLLK